MYEQTKVLKVIFKAVIHNDIQNTKGTENQTDIQTVIFTEMLQEIFNLKLICNAISS